MGRLQQMHGVQGARAQAAAFYSRERTLALRDPSSGLFVSQRFLPGVGGFNATRTTGPVTFAIDLFVASSPRGVLFEVGGLGAGVALAFQSADATLKFAAGGDDASTQGITLSVSDAFAQPGKRYRIVAAVNPGTGGAAMWVNGKLRVAGVSVAPSWPQWTDSDVGDVGDVANEITVRAGADLTALSGASVRELRVYYGQLPWPMPRRLGSTAGGGVWTN